MRQVFLDTETTGLRIDAGDRVVEIGAVAYEDRQRIPEKEGGVFHRYLNPERGMPEEAKAVHGLSKKFLEDKPLFAEVVEEFIAFIKDSEVIMHNAPFDESFLDTELKRAGKPPLRELTTDVLCSLRWARENKPGLGGHSLNALCRHYGINLSKRDYHSAIVDAQLLGDVYYRMREQQGEIAMHTPPPTLDVSLPEIKVYPASDEDTAAHAAFLAKIQEETGEPPIYYRQPG